MIILERIFPDRVVINEDGKDRDIPLDIVNGLREGDVIVLVNGVYVKDINATEKRRSEIAALQNSLWE